MMRGPIGGGGHQQQGSNNNNTHNSNNNNSNAQMHSSGGFHGPGNRSMGQRLLSMGSASPTIGHTGQQWVLCNGRQWWRP